VGTSHRPGRATTQAWLQTGEACAFTAASIRAVEETLTQSPRGALSPAAAFGAAFAFTVPNTTRIDTIPQKHRWDPGRRPAIPRTGRLAASQNTQIWTPLVSIGIEPTSAPNGFVRATSRRALVTIRDQDSDTA
jgi:hypothetical protein